MDMALRFMAIAHVWSSGDIEYVNLLDNGSLTTVDMDGAHVPPWLRERVALLRMCDVNKDTKGESLGRKFTEHMLYVYLTYDEHKELNEIVKSEGVQNEKAK
jgi:predicted HAD superfamily phosphohydrolase